MNINEDFPKSTVTVFPGADENSLPAYHGLLRKAVPALRQLLALYNAGKLAFEGSIAALGYDGTGGIQHVQLPQEGPRREPPPDGEGI